MQGNDNRVTDGDLRRQLTGGLDRVVVVLRGEECVPMGLKERCDYALVALESNTGSLPQRI
jgi:hypothetical protein